MEKFVKPTENNNHMTTNHDHNNHSSPSVEPDEVPKDIKFSLWYTFKSHLPLLILTIFCDIVLPLILYLLLQKRIKSVYALLIAGIPPLVMIILKAILSRRFDALGFLVIISFIVSAVVALVTKNDLVLLLEKSIIAAIVSVILAITLIPFHCCTKRFYWRPLVYYIYQDLIPTKCEQVGLPKSFLNNEQHRGECSSSEISSKNEVAQVYQWIYINCSSFRTTCYLLTSIWSIGFLLQFLARLTLILVHLSVTKIVIYGHIILSSITGVCIILTIICVIYERKRTLAIIRQTREKYLNRQSDSRLSVVTNDFNINYEINKF